MSSDTGPHIAELTRELDVQLPLAMSGVLSEDVDTLLDKVLARVLPLAYSGNTTTALPVIRRAEALATIAGRTAGMLRLRVILGDADAAEGAVAAAVGWYRSAATVAAALEDADDIGFRLYALAQVANAFLSHEQWSLAGEALAELIEAADAAGRPECSWPAALGAARLHLRSDDPGAARYFLDLAVTRYHSAGGASATPDRGEDLAQALGAFARTLYGTKDYEAAADLAQRALAISPTEPDGLRIRAFALGQLGQHEAAAAVYRAWIAAEPGNATARNNLASALTSVQDLDGALATLNEAVEAAPDDLRFRMNRARLLRSLGRLSEAVDECDAIIRIGRRLERDEPRGGRQRYDSQEEYSNQPPAADQVDFALRLRSMINLERDRFDLVRADARALLHRPDPIAQGWGHELRASLLQRSGDLLGALGSYRAAATTGAPSSEVLEGYANLLVRMGQDRNALDVLERLASREHDPKRAIAMLDELARRLPDDPRVRRVRGFAHFEAWHSGAARADLRAAVAHGDGDWRTYRLLGLSLILFSLDDPTLGADIPGAIDALSEAASRASRVSAAAGAEAAEALIWLLDRAFGDPDWLSFLALDVADGDEPAWLGVLGELRPAMLSYARVPALRMGRDWTGSAEALTEAKAAFAAARFPVTAARISLEIADVLLRLYDLDGAAAHLEAAQEVLWLTARPLTAGVGEPYDPRARVAGLEIDYLPVYGIGSAEFGNRRKSLQITLTARAGDYAGAAAQIGDGAWLFADPAAAADAGADATENGDDTLELAPGITISAVVSMAQILRRAREYDRALELLERAATMAEALSSPGLWATTATLAIGDFETANRALDEAERLMPEGSTDVTAMRAELYVHHQRWGEAIALLDSVEAPDSLTWQVELLRARAELGRGNSDAALDLAARMIARIEEDRLGLSRWELREAWSGAAEHPYQIAIAAAVAARRNATAFEFAERARSRAFLDDVGLVDAEVDELLRQIRRNRDDIDWLERLPADRSPSETTRLHDLQRRYPAGHPRHSHEGLPPIDVADLRRRIANASQDLAGRLDRARVEALRRQGLEPVTWSRLRDAAGAVHVVQYHVLDDRVLAFMGADRDEPAVVEVPVDLDEIDHVLSFEQAPGGFDFRRVDLGRLQQAAGALVAPLADLPAGSVICLIPHGRLHAVPLHVLDVEGEPLAIRNQVCYSPSASILVRQVTSDRTAAGGAALVVGDPGGDLAHARIEAVTVARQLGVIPVLGERVSKRLVLDKLFDREAPPLLVHIAAHATVRAGTHGAGIVLGNGPSGDSRWPGEDVLTADDLRGAKLPAALVVLSCCATGRDDVRPGDELTGLVRSFLTAGAAAVVVSQWSVDDLSTSVLMDTLYRRVAQPGSTLAGALRDAAVQVRSMTRDELTGAVAARLGGPLRDPAAIRMLQLDAAALAGPSAFPRTRAALATSPDPALRDAAVEAEDRYHAVQAAGDGGQPFRHPNYWAPFVLIGDWRPPPGSDSSHLGA